MLANVLLVIHLLVAITIIGLVLAQQGKGADMGAAFGGGSSQSLFGARGSANFLSRATSILVAVFFATSLVLAYTYANSGKRNTSVIPNSVIQQSDTAAANNDAENIQETEVPAVPE